MNLAEGLTISSGSLKRPMVFGSWTFVTSTETSSKLLCSRSARTLPSLKRPRCDPFRVRPYATRTMAQRTRGRELRAAVWSRWHLLAPTGAKAVPWLNKLPINGVPVGTIWIFLGERRRTLSSKVRRTQLHRDITWGLTYDLPGVVPLRAVGEGLKTPSRHRNLAPPTPRSHGPMDADGATSRGRAEPRAGAPSSCRLTA